MAINKKYVFDDGKNKFAAYDAETMDSLLEEKASIEALNNAVEELNNEIEQKANTDYVNEEIERIETIIEDLPEPMIFKGTLGTGGTIQELPTASASNEGFTYKVITAGTYAGQSARVGDVFISNGSEWVLVPAGDDFDDTWRAIKVNGTEVLNNAISSGAVNFNEGDQITITFDAETKTLNFNVVNTYTKQEVDDIIYNVLPDGTAYGAVANFNTSLQLPIKSMQIDVNAKQDLHGYGYPWTAGEGKNLLKTNGLSLVPPSSTLFSNATKRTFASNSFCLGLTSNNYFQNNKVTQYLVEENNISVTSSANAYAIIIPITNLNIGETYTLSASSSQGKMSVGFWEEDGTFISNTQEVTSGVLSFTVPQNAFYVGLSFNPRSNDVQATFTNIQLEKGSTATEYAPYENICSISGWNKISLYHKGANMFDKNTIIDGYYINDTDGTQRQNASDKCTDFIEIKPNVTYFVYSEQTSGRWGAWYDENKNFISGINLYGVKTAPINARYMRLTVVRNGNGNVDTFSVNYPSSDTEYHTYNGDTQIISLGGIYYGGILTQDKDGHRQFVITCGSKKINEFNNWYFISSYNYFECTVENLKGSDATSVLNGLICECYATRTAQQAGSGNIDGSIAGWTYTTTNESRLRIKDNNFNNVLNWLDSMGNYLIVYPLETPIIIDLPDGEPINTFNGINNFFADSGDTTVTFKQSVNDAINAALNAANNNRMLGMINMSKGNESEEKEETKEYLNEESNEK